MKGQMSIKKSPLKVKTSSAYNGTPRPKILEASPAAKSVKMAPKLNAEVGAKRVLVNEAKPAGKSVKGATTFKAPRKDGGGSVTDNGYTKVG